MSNRYALTEANNALLAAIAQRTRCVGVAGADQTTALYAEAVRAIDALRLQVLTNHAGTGCQHAAKIHAQLETPHGAYDHPTQ